VAVIDILAAVAAVPLGSAESPCHSANNYFSFFFTALPRATAHQRHGCEAQPLAAGALSLTKAAKFKDNSALLQDYVAQGAKVLAGGVTNQDAYPVGVRRHRD